MPPSWWKFPSLRINRGWISSFFWEYERGRNTRKHPWKESFPYPPGNKHFSPQKMGILKMMIFRTSRKVGYMYPSPWRVSRAFASRPLPMLRRKAVIKMPLRLVLSEGLGGGALGCYTYSQDLTPPNQDLFKSFRYQKCRYRTLWGYLHGWVPPF